MIELFDGSIGSGKSIHVVREVKKRTRRPVIMNFPLRKMRANWHYWDNDEITVERLVEFARQHANERYGGRMREGMILLVIDEASMLWNARDYNAKGKGDWTKKWLRFFAQSRKLGFDVILVAQFDKQIDRQIRACVEWQVSHYSAKHMFPIKYLVRLLFFCHVTLTVRRWYAAQGTKQKSPGLMIFWPWEFSAYDSMRMFDAPTESVFREIGGYPAAFADSTDGEALAPSVVDPLAAGVSTRSGMLDRLGAKQAAAEVAA